MKTVVMREHFKEALQIVERVASKTPSLPILQNILLVLENNKIKLAGTDLQIGITCEFVAKTTEQGSAVFAPRFVTPLLSVMPGGQVSLEGGENQIVLEAGSFRTTVQTVETEEFPIIPSLQEKDPFVEVQTGVFCAGLGQVAGMVGESQARPEIGGVLFAFEKELVRFVATDSFRLAEKKLVLEGANSIEQSFILPQRTAKEVVAILGERQGKIKVYGSPSQVVFDYVSEEEAFPVHIQIVSRVIDGEYPDYQNVIPKEHKTKAVFKKDEFLNHVKAASVFSGKTNEITLSADPTKNRISLVARSSEAGENRSSLEAEVTGEKVEIAFNWRFLIEGLLQMKAPRVELGFNGEDGPALLRAGDQEGYLYVIMPIRA